MMQKRIAALCSVVIGVSAGSGILNHYCTGGYKIIVEGKTIGYVEDSSTYETALNSVNETLSSDFGDEYTLNPNVEIKGVIMNKNLLSSDEELKNNIAQLSSYMTDGYVLVSDGEELCSFKTKENAEKALSLICSEFSIDGGTSSIRESTEIIAKQVSAAAIITPEEASRYLLDSGRLHVKTTVSTVYYSTKDFETIEQNDDTLAVGSKRTVQDGEVGEYAVSAIIEYTNGVQISKSIISEALLKEPTDEIINVGTKEIPNMGSGSFIMPASGKITSPYGGRWGRMHNGIDIGAPTGTPIKASDTGVVIFSGNQGSYGNLIKIDHKNGYVTYYAHCSELLVSEGETVTQGQLIARVGSTGNSTGPHCHFEIQTNGAAQDPMAFLG